jgi:hypothetical protein
MFSCGNLAQKPSCGLLVALRGDLCTIPSTDFGEHLSVLKNSFGLYSAPAQGLKTPFSQCFGLVSGLFWIAGRADNDFFNTLTSSTH